MSYMDDFLHLQIQLDDIKAATNNFSDRPIGTGGFGAVYKGELLLPKGRRTVAFKRLDRKFGQGDVEFWKEITMLSELSHENLASLIHFCREGDERILVYEYASRRSLDRYLDKASLTWIQRLHICLGAARGIAYLHDPKKTQQRVVHRDIKSSNILLDDDWTAKVSDFGLSKITPANQPRTYLVSNAVGTPGYCDPAYHETGILSKECDVYSFGVVLFEVMCGRLCYEFDKDKLIRILVHTWKNCYDENRLDDIVFPDLKQQVNQESLSRFAAIAKRCLNRNYKERPNMDDVVKELEVALDHQQNPELNEAGVTKSYRGRFMEISLEDIQVATNNFSHEKLIGRVSSGREPDAETAQIKAAKQRSLGCSPSESLVEFLSLRYWSNNVVNYYEKVMDGFYDVYGIASSSVTQGKMPSLVDLQARTVYDDVDYEVILVDRRIDKELQHLEERVSNISLECQASGLSQIVRLIQRVANIVVAQMGGPVSDADEMLRRWTARSYELRNTLKTIVLPLGSIDCGLSRHRALLFKVLADKINLACSLVKGSYYTGTDDGAVNLIKIDNGSEYIIDLMGAPGTLIPVDPWQTASGSC